MSDTNVYETLGISIYCSYEELINSYATYRNNNIQNQRQQKVAAGQLLLQNEWLMEASKMFEEGASIEQIEQSMEITNPEQKYILNQYYRHMRSAQIYYRMDQQLIKELKTNNLDVYSKGKESKVIYDKSHKTPYAILGMSPHFLRGDLSAGEKAKTLLEKYPEKEAEIKQAYETVYLKEKSKRDKYEEKAKEVEELEQEGKTQKQHKISERIKNFFKKIAAPALVVLGIATVPKGLPAPENPEAQLPPDTTPKPTEKDTFKEQIKVNGATINIDDNETVITPNEQFVISQYRTTSFANVLNARANGQQTVTDIQTPASFVTQTATAQPITQQDSLSKFKSKIQNDEELRKIVDESLKYVAVQEKQGVNAEEKLDFIMRVIGSNNVDVALGSNINYGGIKNQVLNMVNNVVVYYAEKETGKNGLWIRFEEEERKKPIVTADFSLIDKSGRHYVATTWDGIGNTTDTEHGTTKGINSSVAYLIKESKKLRVLDTYAGNPRINEHLSTLSTIMLGLNNLDDIIVSRNDRER